jgi:hypothetical protein
MVLRLTVDIALVDSTTLFSKIGNEVQLRRHPLSEQQHDFILPSNLGQRCGIWYAKVPEPLNSRAFLNYCGQRVMIFGKGQATKYDL